MCVTYILQLFSMVLGKMRLQHLVWTIHTVSAHTKFKQQTVQDTDFYVDAILLTGVGQFCLIIFARQNVHALSIVMVCGGSIGNAC